MFSVPMFLGVILVFVAGVSHAVPAPFEPLVITQVGEDGWDVSMWGRVYRFRASPLPESIASKGEELLSEPLRFKIATPNTIGGSGARAGDGGSSERVLEFRGLALKNATPEAVDFEAAAFADGIHFFVATRIEYDGMIRVRLRTSVESARKLSRFSYSIDLATPLLEWFNHHVPYDYNALNVDKKALLASAGPIPHVATRFDYAPTFFLGGHEVGLEWWAESNLEWTRSRGDQPIVLDRGPEITRLEITPISAERTLDVRTPFSHEFALFATPMRPPPNDWRSVRFVPYQAAALFKKRPDTRFYWIAFPAHFSAIYNGLPGSHRDEKQLELRQKMAERGVSFIPYAKVAASPSGHPLALAKADEWAANRQRLMVPSAQEKKLLMDETDWLPGQPYGYSVCMERMAYLDWIREESLKSLVEEDLGGLYYDFGSISRMCEYASNAPGPSLGEVGRTSPEFWHYLNLREFYKTLVEGMAKGRPGSILTIHTHGQPRVLSAWADFNFIGEALNVEFRGGKSFGEIGKQPDLYTPDYLALPQGWMDALTFPSIGGITSWLPELKYASDPKNPERMLRYQRGFFAWTLVNDVHVWLGMGDFKAMIELMNAIDEFGSLDEATLSPWWSNTTEVVRDPELKVTTYSHGNRTLIVVANLGKTPLTSTIRFAPNAPFPADAKRVADLEGKGRSRWTPVEDKTIRVTVPAEDFRIFLAAP